MVAFPAAPPDVTYDVIGSALVVAVVEVQSFSFRSVMLVLELVLKLVIAVWHKAIIVFHSCSAHSRTNALMCVAKSFQKLSRTA